jgi:hypothetical protein
MAFIILVALSAFFVAGCAAFFSIKGLVVLFSGSSLAIGIMASSLEIGKLVAASFLHSYWKDIKFLLKVYLCSAVLVLMGVTSLGIFGFLTNAYQTHATTVSSFETKIKTLENEKLSLVESISNNSERVRVLSDIRTTQEQRVKDAGNYKAPRDQAYKAIADANEEAQKKEALISQSRERSISVDREIEDLKIAMNTTTDVGSFKFIANALNTDVDTSVQYFIFALITVFDPLAVTLILALNKLIELRSARKEAEMKELENLLRTEVVPEYSEISSPSTSPAPIFVPPSSAPVIAPDIAPASVAHEPAVTELVEEIIPPAVLVVPPEPEVVSYTPVIVHAAPEDPLWALEDSTPVPASVSETLRIDVPTDMVSGLPVAHVDSEDPHTDTKRRTIQSGDNNSIIRG